MPLFALWSAALRSWSTVRSDSRLSNPTALPPIPPYPRRHRPPIAILPNRLLKVSGRLLQATSNHFRRPDQGHVRGRSGEAPPDPPHANGSTAAAAAGTASGDGIPGGGDGVGPPRDLGRLLAQLSSSTRLDFANRYLEVRGGATDASCIPCSAIFLSGEVQDATFLFCLSVLRTALRVFLSFSKGVVRQNTNRGWHTAFPRSSKAVPAACLFATCSLTTTTTTTTTRAIPQEFRALSTSWDSTKHLSMGKIVLHASLSGLLRNLAHDEPAKQVRVPRCRKDAGCLGCFCRCYRSCVKGCCVGADCFAPHEDRYVLLFLRLGKFKIDDLQSKYAPVWSQSLKLDCPA